MAKQNSVTFGLSHGCYAKATLGDNGEWTFGEVKKLPNLTSMAATVVGGKTDVYADNKIAATLTSYAGQELTVSLTELSEEFKKDILGYKEDTDGCLNEVADAQEVTFAFGCQIEGDVYARRIWYFLCSATNPGESSETKAETPTANSSEIVITARPINAEGTEVIRRIAKNGNDNYETFLDKVELPEFSL